MQKRLSKFWILLGACASLLLPGLGISKAHAMDLPAEESKFVDRVLGFYNQGDDKSIFRDNVTPRFQVSADFYSFQKIMAGIRQKLGKIVWKGQLFAIKNYYSETNLNFYLVAFDVRHEHGVARHYFVLLPRDGHIKLDGWAIYRGGKFLFAQGNLYDMPFEDGSNKKLLSVIPTGTVKDSRIDYMHKKASENIQKRYAMVKPGYELAIKGDFRSARKIFLKAQDEEDLMLLDDLNKKIIKRQEVQNIFKIQLEISKNDWKTAKEDVLRAMKLDDKYWPIDALAIMVESKTSKDSIKIMLYFSKLVTNVTESPSSSCKEVSSAQGVVTQHCHITVLFPMEWTTVNGQLDGAFKVLNRNRGLLLKRNYSQGVLDGRQEYYYPDGKVAKWELFDQGVLKKTQRLDEKGKITYSSDAS